MILFERIRQFAMEDPARPALCDHRRMMSYGELAKNIDFLAAKLANEKIARLAIFLDNGIDWALTDLACALTGIIVIPVPVFFSAEQQDWLLENSGADAIMGPARDGWLTTAEFGWPLQRRQPESIAPLPAHTAKITYTSGTTGRPKGVCLSLAHMLTVAASLADRVAPAEVRQHMTLLPLSTLLENITGLYVPLLTGACSRILPLAEVGFTGSSQFSPPVLARALLQWQPHSLVLVPELLRLLNMLCAAKPALITSLRFVAVGGGKVAPDLVLQAKRLGLPVFEGYGLSECGSVVALNGPANDLIGSVGKSLPHCQVSIAQDGEILVAGAAMLGYLGEAPPASPIATGDLGHLDNQGYLHITGRKKNVQITAYGRNFSPEWIEAEAQIFPAIARIVVFGDALAANVALIQATPGYEDHLAEQVAQLNSRLPDYARIHHTIMAQFSTDNGLLTNNGRPIRERILTRYASAIHQLFVGERI